MLDGKQLKTFFLFSEMPRNVLSEVTKFGEIIEFEKNEIIFSEGEPARDLFGIIDGEIELSLRYRDRVLQTDIQYEESILTRIETLEKDIVIDVLGPGDVFGWSSLIKPRLLTSTATCVKATRVFMLHGSDLKNILNHNPEAGYDFMEKLSEIISQRLRNATDNLVESWSNAFEVNRM